MSFVVTLLGEPTGQGRPRFSRKNGVAYTPAKTRAVSDTLRTLAQQAMVGRVPLDGPLKIILTAEFGVPESWSKKRRVLALEGEIKPTKRPDISNILKLAEDALNGVAYRDDSQIVSAHVGKFYGPQPKVTVIVDAAESVRDL